MKSEYFPCSFFSRYLIVPCYSWHFGCLSRLCCLCVSTLGNLDKNNKFTLFFIILEFLMNLEIFMDLVNRTTTSVTVKKNKYHPVNLHVCTPCVRDFHVYPLSFHKELEKSPQTPMRQCGKTNGAQSIPCSVTMVDLVSSTSCLNRESLL